MPIGDLQGFLEDLKDEADKLLEMVERNEIG
jgi:hypothetical protein